MRTIGPVRSALLFLLLAPCVTNAQGGNEPVMPEAVPERVGTDPDAVFTIVEQMPEFPGGQDAMFVYMAKQAQYPDDAKEAGVQGKVYLSFVVEKDGSISNLKVLRGAYPSLDRQAIRMVQTMPKWNPGKQNGKVCRVQYHLPVAFVLPK